MLQSRAKKPEVEATVAFSNDGVWLLDPNGKTLKAVWYEDIKIAEYSYSKSPRWKDIGSGAPLETSGSGTRHWFMVQTQKDYILVSLDKENYRSVKGAFENRSGKKVETAEERK